MKRTYNQVEIEECFNKIWKYWRNKERQNAAQKALGFLLKQGETRFETIELACRIYTLETQGDAFTFQLSNFINNDEWKDVLEGCKSPEEYQAKLEQDRQNALAVITAWNQACKSHWCQCNDPETRIPMVKRALLDDAFNKFWKESLDLLAKIFKYKPRENDPHSKLRLTLRWFCDITPDKHTVLRISEGEFGRPETEDIHKSKAEPKALTEYEREEVIDLFEEVFGRKINTPPIELDE